MLNYNDTVLTNVNIQRSSLKPKLKIVLLNVPIASHPVMVGSETCSLKKLSRVEKIFAGDDQYDPGRYFTISGDARTLLAQARDAYNTIHVEISIAFSSTFISRLWLAIRYMGEMYTKCTIIVISFCQDHKEIHATTI